jgi:hypothetical protein
MKTHSSLITPTNTPSSSIFHRKAHVFAMMQQRRTLLLQTLVLLFSPGVALQSPSRRNFLERTVLTGGASLSSLLFLPDPANAVQGAAEYDLEYYMRDLLRGNPKQGTKAVSSAPPAPAPRVLKGPLLPLLLNDGCSTSCVPSKVLADLVPNQAATLFEKVEFIRNGASRPFQSKAPWKEEHVTDQYYFDLTSYALWKAAADLLPDFPTRDKFARNVGRELYSTPGVFAAKATKNDSSPLTSTIAPMQSILDTFTSTMYCKSYKLGDNTKPAIFDELDDEDIVNGAAVNCLISVYEPATLGASLQITGEQSRFAPDFVGTTLAAMWESVGIKATYETYFVDPEYRPNPKDYFPNEQLLQFTLSKV